MQTAAVTIISRDYTAQARVWAAALRRQHPDWPLFVCLSDCDGPDSSTHIDIPHTTLLPAHELGIPDWQRFAFQYTGFELACALKPFVMEHLLDQGFERAIYLDADIEIFQPLQEVSNRLADHSILFTPHLTAPLPEDGKRPHMWDLLPCGTYNGGFVAVRETLEAREFLRWWGQRLCRDCIVDKAAGCFVDQRWLEFVPGLFDGVHVLRHPGHNVAYWNLCHRPLSRDRDGTWRAGGEPLIFFHYSGFDPAQPRQLSRHQNRHDAQADRNLQALLDGYLERLNAADWRHFSALEYGHARLSDGTIIPPEWREAVRREMRPLASIADPFEAASTPGLVEKFQSCEALARGARQDWLLARADNSLAGVELPAWVGKARRYWRRRHRAA